MITYQTLARMPEFEPILSTLDGLLRENGPMVVRKMLRDAHALPEPIGSWLASSPDTTVLQHRVTAILVAIYDWEQRVLNGADSSIKNRPHQPSAVEDTHHG